MKRMYRDGTAGGPENKGTDVKEKSPTSPSNPQTNFDSLVKAGIKGVKEAAITGKDVKDMLSDEDKKNLKEEAVEGIKIGVLQQLNVSVALLEKIPNIPESMKTALQTLESQLQAMQNNKMKLASNAPRTAPPSGITAPPSGAIPPETTT